MALQSNILNKYNLRGAGSYLNVPKKTSNSLTLPTGAKQSRTPLSHQQLSPANQALSTQRFPTNQSAPASVSPTLTPPMIFNSPSTTTPPTGNGTLEETKIALEQKKGENNTVAPPVDTPINPDGVNRSRVSTGPGGAVSPVPINEITQYENAYADTFKISDAEMKAQEELDKITNSLSQAYTNTQDQAIPMSFITGQQASLQRQANTLAEPLESRLSRAQAERKGLAEQAQFNLQRADNRAETQQAQTRTNQQELNQIAQSIIEAGGTQEQVNGVLNSGNVQDALSYASGTGLFGQEDAGEQFTLGEGQVRYDAQGNVIARGQSEDTTGLKGFDVGNTTGSTGSVFSGNIPQDAQSQEIAEYIRQTFPEDSDVALAVAMAESGFNTSAYGDRNNKLAPEGSRGLFQINTAVHKDKLAGRDVNNWKDNIDIAREIYDERGGSWQPWGAYTDGRYNEFLEQGNNASGIPDGEIPLNRYSTLDLNALVPSIGRMIYGGKISNEESERVESLIKLGTSEGVTERELLNSFVGFNLQDNEEFGTALQNTLFGFQDGIGEFDNRGLARLINSGNLSAAVTKVENTGMLEAKKLDPDGFFGETTARIAIEKANKVENLVNDLESRADKGGGFFKNETESPIGVVEGTMEGWMGRLRSEEATEIRASVVQAVAEMRNRLLGSAVTESEERFLEPLIPKLSDSPANFMIKLNSLKSDPLLQLNQTRSIVGLPPVDANQLLNRDLKVNLYNGQSQKETSQTQQTPQQNYSGTTSSGLGYTIEQ